MKQFGTIMVVLLIVGCASTISPSPRQRSVGEEPPLRTRTLRSVGEVIYQTYNYEQRTVARLKAPVVIDRGALKASVPANSVLDEFHSDSGLVYCTREQVLREDSLIGGAGPPRYYLCLADQDGNSSFDSWRVPGARSWNEVDSHVPFAIRGEIEEEAKGFKYELLYQGISGDVVGLLYREYIDNMVRAAFQQDLSYTLASLEPTEVSFREIKIRIYSADNNSIDYEVLHGLDTGEGGDS